MQDSGLNLHIPLNSEGVSEEDYALVVPDWVAWGFPV